VVLLAEALEELQEAQEILMEAPYQECWINYGKIYK
jgi:hypothetical protein